MEFFEFFFSGPGWGWKVLGLIFVISAIGEAISLVIKSYFESRLKIVKKELLEEIKKLENNKATIDDVR